MPDSRSRVEKLRAMANQKSSPHEAEVARRMLEAMGEDTSPLPPQSDDPFQNLRYDQARGKWESEETFRARQQSRYYRPPSQRPWDDPNGYARGGPFATGADPFGRSEFFSQAFWDEIRREKERQERAQRAYEEEAKRQAAYAKAAQEAREAQARYNARFSKPPRGEKNYDDYREDMTFEEFLRMRDQERSQKAAYDDLNNLYNSIFNEFSIKMNAQEQAEFEATLRRAAGEFIYENKQKTQQEKKDEFLQKKREEAAMKAKQKLEDEKQRRKNDGDFRSWLRDFEKRRRG